MNRPLSIAVVLALASIACRDANASPPFGARVLADTGQSVQVILDCPVGNYVSCRYSGVVDSVSATNLTPTPVVVNVGQSLTLTLACSAPNARIAIAGQVVGLNASGTASAPRIGGGSSKCPDIAPSTPAFVIRFNVGGP